MNLLDKRVVEALSNHGVLAHAVPGFQPRQGQSDMAMAVSRTLQAGGQLVVEAGTGTGKTYAYLVPVLLSGQRALVSTATKALQDQLFSRDIPRLIDALGLPIRIALLKGRSNYLCLHRMAQARNSHELDHPGSLTALAKIESWAQSTRTGDLAEMSGLDERSPLRPLVTSTRDNCLGSACPSYRACHVNLARKEAMAADVVVINHHLFFADLSVRESGVAELLPTVRITVFDEAHQLNEIGVNFLGQQLSTVQLHELVRDVMATGLQLARGLVDWQTLTAKLEKSVRDWRLSAGVHRGGARLRWISQLPDGVNPQEWTLSLQILTQSLLDLQKGLDMVSELAPDFQRLCDRNRELLERVALFTTAPNPEGVRWVEVGAQLRVVESPLDIAQAFEALMRSTDPKFATHALSRPMSQEVHRPDVQERALEEGALAIKTSPGLAQRAWIFTSATLGDEASLRWFTEPCGLVSAEVMQVSSPFDYAQQAAVYVPSHLPRPGDPDHVRQVASLVLESLAILGGRTLVLTTTLFAMRSIGEQLQAQADARFEVLVQGQSPKRRLMERFRDGGGVGDPQGRSGCVLVASASFWEGFDVPGDALQLVVIDKLPFPPPDDPLFEARSQRMTQQGKSPFADHALPEAAVSLKQGAGRLIRSELDRGILVVCDTRLRAMSYGRRLLSALPPMRRLEKHQDFLEALSQLTKEASGF